MTKRSNLKGILAWIPVILMITFILLLSSQDGQASYYTSQVVAKEVTKVDNVTDMLNSIIRTFAHIGEYAILSMLIGFAVTLNGIRAKLRSIYMIMLGVSVSVIDEFYQIFIPDRYGDWLDIICDGFGITVTAVLLYVLTYGAYKKKLNYGSDKKHNIIGVDIDNITFDEAVDVIIAKAKEREQEYIVTPNVDHIVKLQKDNEFMNAYKDAFMVVTDGTPIMWIAEAYGTPFLQKIPGSDIMPAVCKVAAKKGLSIFLCGGEEGVADSAAANLRKRYKKIKIVGTASPDFGFENDDKKINELIKAINKANPDILVLGLGSPKQEKLIYSYRNQMKFGVALPVGAAIDFVAEEVTRAPKWMRKVGLEWFYRFLQEPGRLFRRYFIDDMKIFWLAWKYRP